MKATEFCECFKLELGDKKIKWHGFVGVLQLPSDRVARVELSTDGTVNEYRRLVVKIVNKRTGVIDTHDFSFDDYLETRSDTRPDYQGGFYVRRKGVGDEADWYIARPSDLNEIMGPIRDYVREWL